MPECIQLTFPFDEDLSTCTRTTDSRATVTQARNWSKRKSSIGLIRHDLTQNLDKTESGFPKVKAFLGDFPSILIGINRINGPKDKRIWLHGFSEDCNLERIWNQPYKYIEKSKSLGGILSPDYSMYLQMALIEKKMNVFRKNAISQIFQNNGIDVIYTLCWAETTSFDYCLEGVERHGIYAVSNIGIQNNYISRKIFRTGFKESIRRLEPKGLILYGYPLDFEVDCEIRVYENENINRLNLLHKSL